MEFFLQETKRLLLNGFEDPRVNLWAMRKFAGAEHYMNVLYEEDFPKAGVPEGAERYARSLLAEAGIKIQDPKGAARQFVLPHMQYVLGVIYWWRHQKVAPFVEDPEVRSALESTAQHFEGIFNLLPATLNPSEIEKQQLAKAHAQAVKEKILPTYERLVARSQQAVKEMLKNGQIQVGGQPQPGGQPIPEELLDEEAKKIIEEKSRQLADGLESKMDVPKVREAKERARRQRAAAKPTAPTPSAEPGKPLTLRDLIMRQRALNQTRKESQTIYQRYLEPVADTIDVLRGILGNIFLKNIKPHEIGYFFSGRPDIRKIMQSEARGWMSVEDLKVFLRRIVPTKRNYKFTLVIDQSGSMVGDKSKRAMEGLVLFIETLEFLGIDYEVIGFHDAPSVYKPFGITLDDEGKNALLGSIEMGIGHGATNDKGALAQGIADLVEQEGDRKVMVVLTDGAGTHGSIAPELQQAREAGIEVIGMGIGSSGIEAVEKNYDRSVRAPRHADIPEKLAQVLEDELVGEPEITPAKAELLKRLGAPSGEIQRVGPTQSAPNLLAFWEQGARGVSQAEAARNPRTWVGLGAELLALGALTVAPVWLLTPILGALLWRERNRQRQTHLQWGLAPPTRRSLWLKAIFLLPYVAVSLLDSTGFLPHLLAASGAVIFHLGYDLYQLRMLPTPRSVVATPTVLPRPVLVPLDALAQDARTADAVQRSP